MSVGFTISTVCSLQFVAVSGHNVLDGTAVHRVVWEINNVGMYRGLNVIRFNNFSNFPSFKYLALYFLDRQKSQTMQPTIYRH